MLDFLRRGVKTWVAKVLLGVLVLSFAVWGIGAEIFSFNFSTPVARVGNTKITAGEYARALRQEQNRRSRDSGQNVTLSTLQFQGVDRQILTDLQRDAALTEELAAHGIRVPDDLAAAGATRQPEFQNPDGSFSPEALRLFLSSEGLTESEFIDISRAIVGRELLTGPAFFDTRVPPGVAARVAAYEGEIRTVATVTLPLEMASEPETPTETELNDYYDENPKLYTEPERRSGTFLHIDFPELKESLQPDEAEIEAAYEAEKESYSTEPTRVVDQITMPDQAAADAAVARLRAKEASFEDIAVEQEQDPETLSLGRVTREDVPADMSEAIFAATEPGVLDPVQLPAGIAIVRITEVELGGPQPLEDVSDQIAERLAIDAAHARASEIVNQIEEMRAGGADLAEIAEASEIPLGQFEGLAEDESLPDGGTAEGVIATPGFIEEVFEALEGEERPIIDTPDEGFLVILLDRIDPGGLLDFAEVTDKVATDWENVQRLEELETRGEEIAADLGKPGATLKATASKLDLSTTTHIPFTRLGSAFTLPQTAVGLAFEVPDGGGFSFPLDDGNGVIVGEVVEVTPLDPSNADQAANAVSLAMEQTIQADTAEYFARAIAAGYESGENPDAVDDVFAALGAQRITITRSSDN